MLAVIGDLILNASPSASAQILTAASFVPAGVFGRNAVQNLHAKQA
jgi:hypothetical protein